MKIVSGKDTFEVVNEIPVGYSVWFIGDLGPKGYLPLCQPDSVKKGFSVNVKTLKAIATNGNKEIQKCISRGYYTLSAIKNMASAFPTSDEIAEDIEICKNALPFLNELRGAENLVEFIPITEGEE